MSSISQLMGASFIGVSDIGVSGVGASSAGAVFPPKKDAAAVLKRLPAKCGSAAVKTASQLGIRPAPERVSSGMDGIDRLTGGFPRGGLTEICGKSSSGRSRVLLAALAAATQRGEICALVDTSDAFDPVSAAAVGINLESLLWVRCGEKKRGLDSLQQNVGGQKVAGESVKGKDTRPQKDAAQQAFRKKAADRVEQALRVTDLLLQSGGFGIIAMDLADVPVRAVRRIPLVSWFRFQRAVENLPTILLVVAPEPCAQTCASLVLNLSSSASSELLEKGGRRTRGCWMN
ncbi:MAG: hypothetical protein JOY93_09330 [Acidobacteriales bacterium]|nr:hypothetical protein [Terriglobales bacterium]